MDPDPGGPKTCGSGGSGFRSATLDITKDDSRLHSRAGGGLKGAQSGLVQASQLAGMWKLM